MDSHSKKWICFYRIEPGEAGTELMQTINEDIKNGTFKPVYLLYGEEAFLKQSFKKKLRAAISGDDTMNYNYFEGKGLDVNELISLADTMPFFSERRLILIEDSGFFKTSSEALAEYLPMMPDTTCIVFVEEAVDKRNKLYKKVKDLGHIAEMKRQDSAQLARWAATILAQNGRKITPSTMNLFLERVGDDMENIRMELEKLISYTMGSGGSDGRGCESHHDRADPEQDLRHGSGDHGGKDEAGDGSVRRPADTQGAADADPVPDCQTV
ncbi:MAG: DNA polymerase III subunit delta [Clostridium fessum]